MRPFVISLFLFIGLSMQAQTLKEILDAPFASDITVSNDGKTIAWVDNSAGERNIFIAEGPSFSSVRQLTNYQGDQGVALSNLVFTADDNAIIYIRGNSKNRQGEPANPALLQENTEQVIYRQHLDSNQALRLALGTSPRLSHNGSSLAFIKGGQVWRVDLTEAELDAKPLFKVRGSQSDIKWSPDDKQIAFTSSRGDHSYIGVYTIEKDKVQFLNPSVDRDFSPEWSPDGESIAFIRRSNAKDVPPFTPQKTGHPWSIQVFDLKQMTSSKVWQADPGMGSVFFGQFPGAALEWTTEDQLVFPWEKEGWMHLYALEISTTKLTELTKGKGIVEDYSLSRDRQSLYFTTNIGDVHRRHIGLVDLSTKQMKMITRGEGSEFNPKETTNGVVFLRTTAQHTSRPATLQKGKMELIGSNAKIFEAQKAPEVIQITATDGRSFNATVFYPNNYNKRKKYPATVFLHGGSRRQMLQTYHYSGYYSNAFALQQYFASKGYIAVMINYRSGIGYGTDFREADNYGITGASEVKDLIGTGLYLASRDDVDTEKIALWGGSYGGYLTAHGLARRSDLFAVGVDIHGVHNWNTELPTFARWYNQSHYPEIAALAFESSPEAYLDGWKSPVLLIHGDDDRNVPFSETVVLSEQLRDRGVYFEQLVFPDEVHGFLLHQNWVDALEATYEFINRYIGE